VATSSLGIEALKAERQGRLTCIACDAPLSGKRRVLCGDPECGRLYNNCYHRDRRKPVNEVRKALRSLAAAEALLWDAYERAGSAGRKLVDVAGLARAVGKLAESIGGDDA
jgi:hypothetical protein